MHSQRPVVVYGPSGPESAIDTLIDEAPVEFRLGNTPLAVLMRTPGRDADLAAGFALTEGILASPAELESVDLIDDGDRYRLALAPGVIVDPEQFRRNTYTSSSCGVCGKASIDAVRIAARRPPPGPFIDWQTLLSLVGTLRDHQHGFDATGGVHGAGIFREDGSLVEVAEDVGRHNAVDKAIGAMARTTWPLGEVILAVSGRISFEIAQKAAVVGIPIVVGVSAASSLAIDLATEMGMTLAGFARGDRMVVYADTDRITTERR